MKNPNYTDFKETSLIYEIINNIIILIFKNRLFFHNSSDVILTKNISSSNNIFFFLLGKLMNNNYDVSSIDLNKLMEAYLNSLTNVRKLSDVVHAVCLDDSQNIEWLRAFKVP